MDEIWKEVVGFEDYYEVSNHGRIRSLDRVTNNGTQIRKGRIIKQKKYKSGYMYAHLSKDGKEKWYTVHRIVAMAFIPNPNNYDEINHKNEIKSDNSVENLEWCTKRYNTNYGTGNRRRSLSHLNHPNQSIQVSQYNPDGSFIKRFPSLKEAERETGVDSTQISKCCRGMKMFNTAGGYKWSFN